MPWTDEMEEAMRRIHPDWPVPNSQSCPAPPELPPKEIVWEALNAIWDILQSVKQDIKLPKARS